MFLQSWHPSWQEKEVGKKKVSLSLSSVLCKRKRRTILIARLSCVVSSESVWLLRLLLLLVLVDFDTSCVFFFDREEIDRLGSRRNVEAKRGYWIHMTRNCLIQKKTVDVTSIAFVSFCVCLFNVSCIRLTTAASSFLRYFNFDETPCSSKKFSWVVLSLLLFYCGFDVLSSNLLVLLTFWDISRFLSWECWSIAYSLNSKRIKVRT